MRLEGHCSDVFTKYEDIVKARQISIKTKQSRERENAENIAQEMVRSPKTAFVVENLFLEFTLVETMDEMWLFCDNCKG